MKSTRSSRAPERPRVRRIALEEADNRQTTPPPEPRRGLGCFGLIWRLVLTALVAAGVLAFLLAGGAAFGVSSIRDWLGSIFAPPEAQVLNTATLLTSIQRGAMIETVRHNFEKVIPVEIAQELFGVTGEKLLYIGVGYVSAGVDLADLDDSGIAVDGRAVTVTLPPARLNACVLDAQLSYVYRHDVGFLRFLADVFRETPNLLELAEQEAIVAFRDSALEAGILEQAWADAERTLRLLFLAAGAESVVVRQAEGVAPQHDPSCVTDPQTSSAQ